MEQTIALPTGVTLAFVEHGMRGGMPVVCLHGVTDSWRSFETVLGLFPGSVHAFAVTQRGHARSSCPASGYRYSDLAADLAAFMDAQAIPSAVIIGHSMGAMVAQRFALDHPGRVSTLVLVGGFATLHRNPGIAEYYRSAISTLQDPIDRTVAVEFQRSTLGRPIPPDRLEVFIDESLQVPAHVWRALFRGFLETPSFLDDMRRLTAPTLLLRGGMDTYATEADLRLLQEAIPGADAKTYSGVGHAVHWEIPAQFTADVFQFVGARRP